VVTRRPTASACRGPRRPPTRAPSRLPCPIASPSPTKARRGLPGRVRAPRWGGSPRYPRAPPRPLSRIASLAPPRKITLRYPRARQFPPFCSATLSPTGTPRRLLSRIKSLATGLPPVLRRVSKYSWTPHQGITLLRFCVWCTSLRRRCPVSRPSRPQLHSSAEGLRQTSDQSCGGMARSSAGTSPPLAASSVRSSPRRGARSARRARRRARTRRQL